MQSKDSKKKEQREQREQRLDLIKMSIKNFMSFNKENELLLDKG